MAATSNIHQVVAIAALALFSLASCCAAVTTAVASTPSLAPGSSVVAPSPTEDPCLMALYNMSDCLSFVNDGSNLTKPDKGCCPEVAGLLDSNPKCLCKLLSKPDSIGIKIDLKQAFKLPSVCAITTPPVSTCTAVGYPVSMSPTPSVSPSMAPDGSTLSPSTTGVHAPSPGSSSDEASAENPSGNKVANGASSGIEAYALTFIFGLATVSATIFF